MALAQLHSEPRAPKAVKRSSREPSSDQAYVSWSQEEQDHATWSLDEGLN